MPVSAVQFNLNTLALHFWVPGRPAVEKNKMQFILGHSLYGLHTSEQTAVLMLLYEHLHLHRDTYFGSSGSEYEKAGYLAKQFLAHALYTSWTRPELGYTQPDSMRFLLFPVPSWSASLFEPIGWGPSCAHHFSDAVCGWVVNTSSDLVPDDWHVRSRYPWELLDAKPLAHSLIKSLYSAARRIDPAVHEQFEVLALKKIKQLPLTSVWSLSQYDEFIAHQLESTQLSDRWKTQLEKELLLRHVQSGSNESTSSLLPESQSTPMGRL